MNTASEPAARLIGKAWNAHNRWLCAFGVGSIVFGVIAYLAANGPDGRDPFYVGVAIQFVVWGAIDATIGVQGLRDAQRTRSSIDASSLLLAKGEKIIRLLRWNRYLNAVWLAMGVGLIVLGMRSGSPGTCGHGVGVLFQAMALTIGDEIFLKRLRRASRQVTY